MTCRLLRNWHNNYKNCTIKSDALFRSVSNKIYKYLKNDCEGFTRIALRNKYIFFPFSADRYFILFRVCKKVAITIDQTGAIDK